MAVEGDEASWVQQALRLGPGDPAGCYLSLLARLEELKRAGWAIRNDQKLARVVEAIANNVSWVDRGNHGELLQLIFGGARQPDGLSPWLLGAEARRAVLDLAAHAVATGGALAQAALCFLAQSLAPPPHLALVPADRDPNAPPSLAGCAVSRGPDPADTLPVSSCLAELRTCLGQSLTLAPSLCEEAARLLIREAPTKYHGPLPHMCHTEVCLSLCLPGAPLSFAGARFLAAAVAIAVEMDVEVPWRDLDAHPSPSGEAPATEAGGELDEADMFEEAGEPRAQKAGPPPPDQQAALLSLAKLEAVLEIICAFLQAPRGQQDAALAHDWALSAFQRCCLPVPHTRAAHFFVLLSASHHPRCPKLQDLLLRTLADGSAPPAMRTTALGYLASLVCHVSFVPPDQARAALLSLSRLCAALCRNGDTQCVTVLPPGDAAALGAGCQALMWALLCAPPSGPAAFSMSFALGLRVHHMVTHAQDPLRSCPAPQREHLLARACQLNLLDPDALAALGARWREEGAGAHGVSPSAPSLVLLPFCSALLDGVCHRAAFAQQARALLRPPEPAAARYLAAHGPYLALSATRIPPGRPPLPRGHREASAAPEHFGLSESPGGGLDGLGSYRSEDGDGAGSFGAPEGMRRSWAEGSQRPVPIGMKAREILRKGNGSGVSGMSGVSGSSPVLSGSLNADNGWSPDVMALSYGARDAGRDRPQW